MDKSGDFKVMRWMLFPENKEELSASLEINVGRIFCAFTGFNCLYQFGVSSEEWLCLLTVIKLPSKLFSMSSDSRNDPSTLYVSLQDKSLRVYTVSAEAYAQLRTTIDPGQCLCLRLMRFGSYDILLGAHSDRTAAADKFCAFIFENTGDTWEVRRSDVECNASMKMCCSVQTSGNTMMMFDGGTQDIVEFEIQKVP